MGKSKRVAKGAAMLMVYIKTANIGNKWTELTRGQIEQMHRNMAKT